MTVLSTELEIEVLGRKEVPLETGKNIAGIVKQETARISQILAGSVLATAGNWSVIKTKGGKQIMISAIAQAIPGKGRYANLMVGYSGPHMDEDDCRGITTQLGTVGYESPKQRETIPEDSFNKMA